MDSSRTAVEVTHFILCRNSWKDKFVLKWIILGCLAVHWNKLEKIVRILHIHLHQLSHLCIIHIRVSGRFGYNLRQGRSNGNKVFVNVVHVGFIFRYIKVWFSSRCDRPLDFRSVIPDLYLCWEENPTPETDFFFFFIPVICMLNIVAAPASCWTPLGVSQLSLQSPTHYEFHISALPNPAVLWTCTGRSRSAGRILIQQFVFYLVVK